MKLAFLTGLVVALLFIPASPIQAGGTEPSPDGSYENSHWGTYYPPADAEADSLSAKLRVDRLLETDDESWDYYAATNVFRQLKNDQRHIDMDWGLHMGQWGGSIPDHLDWDPGVQEARTTSAISLEVSTDAVGLTLTHEWTNQWYGDYSIYDSGTWTPEGDWKYRFHKEDFNPGYFYVGSSWDRMSHGNTWKVEQDHLRGVWVKGALTYERCNWFSCATPAREDSGWQWIGLPFPHDEEVQGPCINEGSRSQCAYSFDVGYVPTIPGIVPLDLGGDADTGGAP